LWLRLRPHFGLGPASIQPHSSFAVCLPRFEQSANRVTRKVLLFCVCWFSFDKAKKTQKTQKKRKNKTNAPTADIGVLWRINDTSTEICLA
jgi:hypothetical protein